MSPEALPTGEPQAGWLEYLAASGKPIEVSAEELLRSDGFVNEVRWAT